MKIGKCKLCNLNKKLCDHSHIIPNHTYKILKDENKKLMFLESGKICKRQTGEFEGGILCQTCENILSDYESYGNKLIFENKINNIQREIKKIGDREILEIKGGGYDYQKFKLYLLSILWRSSISSRSFFKNVNLGHENNEILRNMILNYNPGEIYEYPCLIVLPSLMFNKSGFDLVDVGITKSPITYYNCKLKYVDFLITGCRYQFAITTQEGDTKLISVQKDALILPFFTPEESEKCRN